MDEISPQDLKARLTGSDRPFLLDVRQDWETRLCRLDNAVHIPIEEIELRADELNAADEIVVYCHQGVRSAAVDRKSTRLNSSYLVISYAVFCLKKKTTHKRASTSHAADQASSACCLRALRAAAHAHATRETRSITVH